MVKCEASTTIRMSPRSCRGQSEREIRSAGCWAPTHPAQHPRAKVPSGCWGLAREGVSAAGQEPHAGCGQHHPAAPSLLPLTSSSLWAFLCLSFFCCETPHLPQLRLHVSCTFCIPKARFKQRLKQRPTPCSFSPALPAQATRVIENLCVCHQLCPCSPEPSITLHY